jgi:hypothetical protein
VHCGYEGEETARLKQQGTFLAVIHGRKHLLDAANEQLLK